MRACFPYATVVELRGNLYSEGMFDEALAFELVHGSERVPTAAVAWLVTGQWPAPQLCCDVSFPRPDYSGLLEF